MDEFYDLDSTIKIRTPSNKMEGVFVLYRAEEDQIEGTMVVAVREASDLVSTLGVRVEAKRELNVTLDVKYRGYSDLEATMEVVGSSYLESYLEVRPNNRMFGKFELLPPPRVEKLISSTEDSTTRGREDLMTINYGDSKRMMISDGVEHLESFVKFGDLESHFVNVAILEKASLRLYYAGNLIDGTNIEVHLPNTKWNEYGITHANKPSSTELIADSYTINRNKRYIEFDIMSLVNRWVNGQTSNLGVIIKSNSSEAVSFSTREGEAAPSLDIRYITNQVYSLGRAELESTMFIWGVNQPEDDLKATLEVHSDWGFEYLESQLYVHQVDVPLDEDITATMVINKPDQHSSLVVAVRENDDSMYGHISVWGYGGIDGEKQAILDVNKRDLPSFLLVDPNAFLESIITVKGNVDVDLESTLTVTREAIAGFIAAKVSRTEDQDGFINVRLRNHSDIDSFLTVSKESLNGRLTVGRAFGESEIEAIVEVPNYDYLDCCITVSKEEMSSSITVHHFVDLEAKLWIKDREYLDSTLMIHETSEMAGFIDVVYVTEKESTIAVSRRDLEGFLHPRVIGHEDLESSYWVRQRDASDLTSYIVVSGSFGAYYFII